MVRVFYHWLLIATLVLVSNVLSQGFSNTESGPILVDPQGRNAEQLLGDANQNRASNRLSEAVILAYLALKAANADPASAASIRARAHLFLSEAMDDFGYRAMERIHAKAADRERAGDALASSTLDPAPFYSRLGAVAMHGGDFSVAEYYLHRALDAYEKTKPPNPLAIAATLVHLAELKIKQADVHRVLNRDALSKLKVVEANLERAFSLVDKADNLKLSMAIYELQAKLLLLLSSHLPEANQIFAQKLLEQAEGMFRQALDRRQKDRGSRLREQLPLLNGLMSVLRRTGRFVEAMDITGVLLDITEQIQQGDPDIALNMALASEHLGNKELTRKLCDMVMTQEEARVAEVSSKSGEAIALAFTAKGRHQSMVSLALLSRSGAQDDNHARLMLDIVLRRKAIVTDAERTFWKTLYEDPAPDLQRARDNLNRLRYRLSAQVVKADGDGLWNLINTIEKQEALLSVEPWWRDFQVAPSHEQEREIVSGYSKSILEGMKPWDAISAQKGQIKSEKVALETVLQNLPPGAVLIEFAKIDDFDLKREVLLETARYWALVLNSDGRTKAIDLGDAGRIEQEITAALRVLHSGDPLLTKPQLEAMSNLYKVLWLPLEGALGEAESVILSPDAVMALVPFAALIAPNGRFLIEARTLYLVTTGRQFSSRHRVPAREPGRSVIVANLRYDAENSPGTSAESGNKTVTNPSGHSAVPSPLVELESTEEEGNIVREVLQADAELLSRGDATEGKVRRVQSPHVFHLATHGLFLKEEKAKTEKSLSSEDTVALDAAYIRHVRSLSRSGLALSGINVGGTGVDEDGLLTAFDVIGMNLFGTELVVLSACDTALGDPVAGEGVLGLRRSFHIAGARYVVMSLWRLSDKEAVRQMRAFYKAYKSGKNPVVALRDVQRQRISRLREALGHAPPPALWAALTVEGM